MKFNYAIIDFDPIVYRCGFSIETYNKELDLYEVEPLKNALYNIDSMMKSILKETECDKYYGYLTSSDKSNFRFSIYPDYKSNRKDARRPVYYSNLREFMIKKWNAEVVNGEEADDTCSIKHCELNNNDWDKKNNNSVVCSFDKDFNNIPGWHYNYVKRNFYYITEEMALKSFYLQILTGDPSDGVPRIQKGWKKKEAEKKINDARSERDFIRVVIEVFRDTFKEKTEQELIKLLTDRGRLLWLRRIPGEMWEPKF